MGVVVADVNVLLPNHYSTIANCLLTHTFPTIFDRSAIFEGLNSLSIIWADVV